jgi:hypothetical protein
MAASTSNGPTSSPHRRPAPSLATVTLGLSGFHLCLLGSRVPAPAAEEQEEGDGEGEQTRPAAAVDGAVEVLEQVRPNSNSQTVSDM